MLNYTINFVCDLRCLEDKASIMHFLVQVNSVAHMILWFVQSTYLLRFQDNHAMQLIWVCQKSRFLHVLWLWSYMSIVSLSWAKFIVLLFRYSIDCLFILLNVVECSFSVYIFFFIVVECSFSVYIFFYNQIEYYCKWVQGVLQFIIQWKLTLQVTKTTQRTHANHNKIT